MKRKNFSVPFLLVFAAVFGYIGVRYLFNSHAIVPTTPTVPVCGERQASDMEQYTGPQFGASPISTKAIDGTALNMAVDNFKLLPGSPDKWYLRDNNTFRIYNASDDGLISTFTLPNLGIVDNAGRGFGVDAGGNVYVSGSFKMVKLDTTGTIIWTRTISAPISSGAYSYGSGAGFRVAAPDSSINGSFVWDANGNQMPNNIVTGSTVHVNQTSGDIMTGTGSTVHIYSPDGMTEKFTMGTNLPSGGPGPFHFYLGGGIEELPDGRYVVADSQGLLYFDSNGTYLGKVHTDPGANTSNAIDNFDAFSDIILYNGNLYYASGANFSRPQYLAKVPLTTTNAVLNMPQGAPFHLGIGAGPFTNAQGNYFPPGTTPQVFLQFYPWWAAHAGSYSGSYTIRSIQQVLANQSVAATSYSLSGLSSSAVTNIPVSLPTTKPGFYEMDVKLKNTAGTVIGADCLQYSIGAPGDTLDLPGLPGGDAYDIALAHEFGTKVSRGSAVKMSNLLPTPDPCVGTINFPAATDSDVQAAAAEASATGVIYEIQMADGAASEKTAVSEGCWQSRVQEIVSHYKNYIHAWEAWNEGNNTYSGNGTTFATNVLIPFTTAVKAADPTATVVAGSVLNISTGYWQAICAAGGLNNVDAIGDHPYTGHNRSFEEQGQIAQLQSIQSTLSACGHANLPIWNTEAGFWNNGTMSEYTQGAKVVRRKILQDSIGIHNSVNFLNSGSFQGWALLNGYLKEGGLASVTMQHKLGGRDFVRWISTGIPHTYAAEYGPSASDSGHVAAVWADDYSVDSIPQLDNGAAMTLTDEWGGTTSLSSRGALNLTGMVQYIDIPAGRSLSISPKESYGSNLALASSGTTATASSSYNCGSYSLAPDRAIDGVLDTQGLGNICDGSGMSIWVGGASDSNPTYTLTLPAAKTIDRVYVSSQGISSVEVGLRNYTVSFDTGSGSFGNPINVPDQFFARNNLIQLPNPLTVTRIQISNMAINYSGYGDGLPPSFWNSGFPGQPTIYEVEAFAPGSNTAPAVAGDLNGDGKVDIFDLSILLSDYSKTGTGLKSDLNGDGKVDVFDLSILLSHYGS